MTEIVSAAFGFHFPPPSPLPPSDASQSSWSLPTLRWACSDLGSAPAQPRLSPLNDKTNYEIFKMLNFCWVCASFGSHSTSKSTQQGQAGWQSGKFWVNEWFARAH